MQKKNTKYWDTREELNAIHGEIESLNDLLKQMKESGSSAVNPSIPNPPMFTTEDFRDIGDIELSTMLKDLANDVEANGISITGSDKSYLIQTIRVASERLHRASTRHSNHKFNTDGA